jgi:hypothetical protein
MDEPGPQIARRTIVLFVVQFDISPEAQNGHIRNDTCDVSRRYLKYVKRANLQAKERRE